MKEYDIVSKVEKVESVILSAGPIKINKGNPHLKVVRDFADRTKITPVGGQLSLDFVAIRLVKKWIFVQIIEQNFSKNFL